MVATSTDSPLSLVPVTEADLSILRTLNLPSGYRGVYAKQRGKSNLWQARPLSGGATYTTGGRKGRLSPRILIGTFRHPRDAARAIVRWWKERFGEEWVGVYRNRTWNPWWARRVVGGWEVVVRKGGEERVLPGGPHPTRQDASDHFRLWAKLTYGESAWLRLRRGT